MQQTLTVRLTRSCPRSVSIVFCQVLCYTDCSHNIVLKASTLKSMSIAKMVVEM
jgi:hypothetical protein